MDMSIAEAAAYLGIHEKTVRRRIKDGTLTARRIKRPQGFEWRITVDHLDSPEVEVSGPEHESETVPETGTALALAAPVQLDSHERSELLRVIREQAETIGYLKALLNEKSKPALEESQRIPWWRFWHRHP
jgi:excisionase family DNA binding protein